MALPGGSRFASTAAVLMLAGALLAADSPVGTVLLDTDFERDAVGAKPKGWLVFVDKGNSAAVAAAPAGGAAGKRCMKLTRAGGTVWKPMISGAVRGEAKSCLQVDFDWYLPALFDSDARAFVVVLRGDGNRAVVSIAIGGPGGVSVQQGRREQIALGFPVKPRQWGHVAILCRPISLGARGTFDVTVSQDGERMTYPNIAFIPDRPGQYPKVHWYSPYFHLAAGEPGAPAEAYFDNVRVQVVAGE